MSEEQEKVTSEAPAAPEVPKDPASPASKKSAGMLWVIVVIVLIVVGLLFAFQQGYLGGGGDAEPTEGDTSTEVTRGDPSDIVANVVGVPITRAELTEKIEQIRATIPEGVDDPTINASFQYSVLDEMISLLLLVTEAERQGIAVSEAQIDEEYNNLVEIFGSEEDLDTQLQATGLSREELRENMENEILIRALLENNTNIAEVVVTDEEVQGAYDLAIAGNEDSAPPLEQVEDMLKAQLEQQKTSAIVEAYIADLKAQSSIEMFL
jgi:FKBP-type peptidyl-prolyl cis-trans isomerase (trigger factor)